MQPQSHLAMRNRDTRNALLRFSHLRTGRKGEEGRENHHKQTAGQILKEEHAEPSQDKGTAWPDPDRLCGSARRGGTRRGQRPTRRPHSRACGDSATELYMTSQLLLKIRSNILRISGNCSAFSFYIKLS